MALLLAPAPTRPDLDKVNSRLETGERSLPRRLFTQLVRSSATGRKAQSMRLSPLLE